ncbi:MAG: type II toxin-antitoxin system prevent-host-death family antitoxin [Burkholderiaceae bacterium]|jgi:prevent-host-death family protein|nr:MAG: type II toxin-antitoxin system prevent-host-death family antitoxin [Burkholderiaceae bacterium]
MTATAVGLFEAKTRLSEYVSRAEKGEEVIITRHNKPVAKLVPLDTATARAAKKIPPFIQRTHDMGVPRVDLSRANQLLDELDVQEFLRLDAQRASERRHGRGDKA